MSSRDEFEFVTTQAAIEIYRTSKPIFDSLLREVRELSKKKPEATISLSKVKMINRVLDDVLVILKGEPSGKYLEPLDNDTLPQMSDALLTMVQFASALNSFEGRYHKKVGRGYSGRYFWITEEQIKAWDEADAEDEEDEEDDGSYDQNGADDRDTDGDEEDE